MKIPSKKLLIPIIFTVAVTILSYWGYSVFTQRYIEDEVETENETELGGTEAQDNTSTEADSEEELTEEDEVDEEIEAQEFAREDTFMEISTKDCDSDCKTFSDADDKKYCKNICGLASSEKSPADENSCDLLDELEKDYCFKNLAVQKTEGNLCEKIEDKGVRRACQYRIMEDIIDRQNGSRDIEPQ